MTDTDPSGEGAGNAGPAADEDADLEALRREVEETYDFEEFGPADMASMTGDEWEAVFDADTWITGPELLDRVERTLQSRIASREVFGVLDRIVEEDEERLVLYSDEGYAVVRPTGEVRGRGTVLQEIEPTVVLCSMESYDPPTPPENWELPDPEEVESGSGELGNLMMQAIAGTQLLAGVALVGAWLFLGVETLFAPLVGGLFALAGLFLFSTVANARLSDRFRSEEYRERLRALQAAEEREGYLPEGVEEGGDSGADR
ncbi:hypothetical protein GCM10027435_00020 [Haloparvum alkalitolerans]|uniref:DUF7319 domain-containing protein n=1 Tax=Haloparvum alkalitolerans TaxID=1042953 RepID=UPI003CF138FF